MKKNGDIYFGYTGKKSDINKKRKTIEKAPRPLIIIKTIKKDFFLVAKGTSSKKMKTYEMEGYFFNTSDSFIVHDSMLKENLKKNVFENENWNIVSNRSTRSFYKIKERNEILNEILNNKFDGLSNEEIQKKLYLQYTELDRKIDIAKIEELKKERKDKKSKDKKLILNKNAKLPPLPEKNVIKGKNKNK